MLDGTDHFHERIDPADPDLVAEHHYMPVRSVNFRRIRHDPIRFLGYNYHYWDNFPSERNTENQGGIELVLNSQKERAASTALVLILLFAGVFMIAMVMYTGLAQTAKLNLTNGTEVQDLDAASQAKILEQEQPILLGINGLFYILVFVLIIGGIAVFVKAITGRRR